MSHFIVPQEEPVYPPATVFYTVNEDITKIEKSFIIEQRIQYTVIFNPKEESSYLLERKILAEDWQG